MKSFLEIYCDLQNKNQWQTWKQLKSVRLLLPLIFGICGFYIVWLYGPQIHMNGDSYNYLINSTFLLEWLVRYAPLYSILLSIPQLFGVSVINSVSVVGSVGYGILVFCFASMLLKHTRHFLIFSFGVLHLLVHFYMAERFTVSLSDALFSTFCMVFLFGLFQAIEKPTYQKIFLLGIFAGLCALQRYIGTVAIAFGGCVILSSLIKNSLLTRIKYLFLFGLTASTPLFLWLMKNLYFTGSLTGSRPVAYTSLFSESLATLDRFRDFIDGHYLFAHRLWAFLSTRSFPILLIIILFFIPAVFLIIKIFISAFHYQQQTTEVERNQQISYTIISLLFFFPLAYWVYLSTLRAFVHFDPLRDFRFSMPMIAPLGLFFLITLDRAWYQGIRLKSEMARKGIFTLGAIFLCLWLLIISVDGGRLLHRIILVRTNGWERLDGNLQATHKSILESELILWLRQNKLPGKIIVFGGRIEQELIFYHSENRVYHVSINDFEKRLMQLLNNDSQAFIVLFDLPVHDIEPYWLQQHKKFQKRDPDNAAKFKPGGFTIQPSSLPSLDRKDVIIEELVHFPDGAIYQARLIQ